MSFYYINSDIYSADRYDLSKFLEYDNNSYETINSYFLSEINKLPIAGTFICSDERPDTLSYKIYGDTQFWWILLSYNGIYDWTDGSLSVGKLIRYPSLSKIEALMFKLKAQSRAVGAS